jgi:hypothetical protein
MSERSERLETTAARGGAPAATGAAPNGSFGSGDVRLALRSASHFTSAKGDTVESTQIRAGWLNMLGGIGAIALPLTILFSFFTSNDDYDDTAAGLIGYAKGNEGDLWLQQIVALAAPLLIGFMLASLWGRLRGASEGYRVLTVIGGTLFIAFFATGMTLWSAPLLAPDELTTASAEAYLAFDDAGWVLLGLGGISMGAMIIGVSLAALELALVPKWAGWVSLAFGVVSLATVAAVGVFAWTIWLVAAGCFMLFARTRTAEPVEARAVV